MLTNKIDFAVIVSVKNANPNGDPLNGNRPRVNYDGNGELSDVCIKRKIRNRLMEDGFSIFVQSDDNRSDEYRSLRSRADCELLGFDTKNDKKYREEACKKWIDVRAFGQVFAFKGSTKKTKKEIENGEEQGDDKGASIGIRGPVSIHPAFSISPINITSLQITKSVNGEKDGPQKASDTIGMKHRVDFGLYVFYGSMNPQLSEKTTFNNNDAEAIKQSLIHLFENDSSSARPEGSMEVHQVYWWKHNSKNGQYSSAQVHRSLEIILKDGISDPKCLEDYDIKLNKLENLEPEIYKGY